MRTRLVEENLRRSEEHLLKADRLEGAEPGAGGSSAPEAMPLGALLREAIANTTLLAQRQLKLAELEATKQLKQEVRMGELLGSAAAVAYAGLITLLVAAALALGVALDRRYWLGALLVGSGLLVASALVGAIGWARRVRRVLPKSREEIHQEMTWAKTRLA